MAKVIAGVVGTLILCIIVGIVLTAIGKFLLGIALVIGIILIVGVLFGGIVGTKILDIWKSI